MYSVIGFINGCLISLACILMGFDFIKAILWLIIAAIWFGVYAFAIEKFGDRKLW